MVGSPASKHFPTCHGADMSIRLPGTNAAGRATRVPGRCADAGDREKVRADSMAQINRRPTPRTNDRE